MPKFNNISLLILLTVLTGLIGVGIKSIVSTQPPYYADLEEYLATKQWLAADLETDRILLKIAQQQSALDQEAIANFDCDSLREIDRLWSEYSNEHFGLSRQKEIFVTTGNQFDLYRTQDYQAFGAAVKWRVVDAWKSHPELTFNDTAPPGHLPSPGVISAQNKTLRIQERHQLLSRLDECSM